MSKSFIADIALIVVAISWGVTFLPVQSAVNEINVFSFLFFRFALASVVMYFIALKFGLKFDKNSFKFGVLLGIFLFAGFGFQTYALKFTLSSTVAFITGLNVVMVPFLMFAFLGMRVRFTTFMGAILALVGLYFLSGASDVGLNLGEILTVICALSYALHIAFTGKFVHLCNLYAMVVVQFATVGILSLISAILFGEKSPNSLNLFGGIEIWFDSELLFAVVLTALLATVFAFFVQTLAQQHTTPAKTALIFTLEPVSAGVIGYFVGGEILSLVQICGAGLILLGIVISEVGGIWLEKRSNGV
ncbi:DMT family transporter [Campylobacter geochelonis]|uniref:Permeases of the drug/metabolite transporter n=1 Tax=Campylobacter geochelonis TaxID=1780362 RepID=A0A128EB77_9BACT|nr:DMT family transporter [Campylobacter geochelonis]QKF70484.1 EamA/RhaT family transporter, type 5 [Campylobacter geochelonis]CZE46189.1 permeases of the drug/metabolite transporter [Campylobacter geochelonis]